MSSQQILKKKVESMQEIIQFYESSREEQLLQVAQLHQKLAYQNEKHSLEMAKIKQLIDSEKSKRQQSTKSESRHLESLRKIREEMSEQCDKAFKFQKENSQLEVKLAQAGDIEEMLQQKINELEAKDKLSSQTILKQATELKIKSMRQKDLEEALAHSQKQLVSTKNQLMTEASRINELAIQNTSLEQSLQVNAFELQILREENEKNNVLDMRRELEELKISSKRSSDCIENLQRKREILFNALQNSKEVRKRLESEKFKLIFKNESLTKTLQEHKSAQESNARQLAKTHSELTLATELYEEESHKVVELEERLECREVEVESLKEKLNLLSISQDRMKEKLKHVEDSFSVEKEHAERYLNEFEEMKKNNLVLTTAMEKDHLGLNEKQIELQHKNEIIAQLRKEKQALMSDLSGKKNQIMNLKLVCEERKRKIVLSRKKIENFRDNLHAVRNDLNALFVKPSLFDMQATLQSHYQLLVESAGKRDEWFTKQLNRQMCEERRQLSIKFSQERMQLTNQLKEQAKENKKLLISLESTQEQARECQQNLQQQKNSKLALKQAFQEERDKTNRHSLALEEQMRMMKSEFKKYRQSKDEELMEQECKLEAAKEHGLKILMEKMQETQAQLKLRLIDTRIEAAQILHSGK